FVTSMDPSSGPDGTFEVVLSLPGGTERRDSLIYAEIPAPRIKVETEDGFTFNVDDGVIQQGSVSVSFGVGETVRDIHIVIAAADRGHTLYGKITTQDGAIPENLKRLSIDVTQENEGHPPDARGKRVLHARGRIAEDGSYRIERIKPGPFRVSVGQDAPPEDEFSLPPRTFYTTVRFDLEMPDNVQSLQYDVHLSELSYIQGKVVDQGYNPVPGVRMMALRPEDPPGSPGVRASAMVNDAGIFVLRVRPGAEYSIEVRSRDATTVYSRIERVSPPAENVVLQVDPEEN
ncbi:MAG TPA: carboxypeptidase-like regulatory domain-containing protein, partial [bacterium]|nr:carboxypeptidase-like regulatory domain-containing protein [bacterium]